MLANITVCPLTAFPCASFKVTVTVDVVEPLAVTLAGDAAIEDVPAEMPPGIKVTVLPLLAIGEVMASVFTSAFVELTVQVDTPDVLVVEHAP